MNDVQADLILTREADSFRIAAHVAAAPPRPLTWRLVVEAAGPNGRSSTVQSGATDGSGPLAVTVSRVNQPGVARLEVRDRERVVAERVERFGETAAR